MMTQNAMRVQRSVTTRAEENGAAGVARARSQTRVDVIVTVGAAWICERKKKTN